MHDQLGPDELGPTPKASATNRQPSGSDTNAHVAPDLALPIDGIRLGPLMGGRIRLGWSWISMPLLVLYFAWSMRDQPASGDLPLLAGYLLAFAAIGCLLQVATYVLITSRTPIPSPGVVATAFGFREPRMISTAPTLIPRASDVQRALQLGLAPVLLGKLAIFLGGLGWILYLPSTVNAEPAAFSPSYPIFVAAAVFAVQCLVSLAPVPGTCGKALLRSGLSASLRNKDPQRVERLSRKCEAILAIGLVLLGLCSWNIEPVFGGVPVWPFWLLLGIVMWVGRDTQPLVPVYDPAQLPSDSPPSTLSRSGRLSTWWRRRRARIALKNEHTEASEASQAESILEKLHASGFDALTSSERALLKRVSQRLREEREKL